MIIDKINEKLLTMPDGKQYSNNSKVPFETALFTAYNSSLYDGVTKAKELTVSDLIAPIKKTLYKIKFPKHRENNIMDISYLLASAKGTSTHSSLESALDWYNKQNPDNPYIKEKRSDKIIDDWLVSGKFDFVTPKNENGERTLKDLKNVSGYQYKLLMQEKENLKGRLTIEEALQVQPIYTKFQAQLSLYKYLNPDLNISNTGSILFMLTSKPDFQSNTPLDSEIIFPLFTSEEIEEFITNRIKKIKHYIETDTMPLCTPVERGTKPASYSLKRYSQKTGKYRTVAGSKFDDYSSLQNFITTKGKPGDKTEIIEPSHILCQYCTWNSICEQNTQGE